MISVDKSAPSAPMTASVYAYARSAAVCLSYTENRRSQPTAAVEFSRATSPRSYDWAQKVVFQLTPGELAEATAFLFFPWSGVKWVHGQGPGTKEVSLEPQQGRVLFSFRTSTQHIFVPVVPHDLYFFRNFLLSRLLESQPDLPVQVHMRSLELLARQCGTPSC